MKVLNEQEAINHIESLYPPDSEFGDTAKIWRDIIDNTIGNKVGYENWRNLSESDLITLAYANLEEHGVI